MPKAKRRPKKARPVKLPEGGETIDMTRADKEERLTAMLAEFDRELEKRLSNMEAECRHICLTIQAKTDSLIASLPSDMKNTPFVDVVKGSRVEPVRGRDSDPMAMAEIGSFLGKINTGGMNFRSKALPTPGWTATPKETPLFNPTLKRIK